jgi:hypothetical protein
VARAEIARACQRGKLQRLRGTPLSPPARSAQVAWFIFANADIPDGYLRVGQVQFFSHRLWPEAVTDRDFVSRLVNGEFPAELDEDALTWLTPRDGADAHVYARVELSGPRAEDGRNPYFQGEPPEQWARDLVSGIVAAGTFRVGGSAWKLLSGAALYHGEIRDRSGSHANWSGSQSFDDPERLETVRSARHPLHEGTGEVLEELEPRVAERLAHRDPAAQEALAEVRWYESVRAQPDPAQRVVLHIRALSVHFRQARRCLGMTRSSGTCGNSGHSTSSGVTSSIWRTQVSSSSHTTARKSWSALSSGSSTKGSGSQSVVARSCEWRRKSRPCFLGLPASSAGKYAMSPSGPHQLQPRARP